MEKDIDIEGAQLINKDREYLEQIIDNTRQKFLCELASERNLMLMKRMIIDNINMYRQKGLIQNQYSVDIYMKDENGPYVDINQILEK